MQNITISQNITMSQNKVVACHSFLVRHKGREPGRDEKHMENLINLQTSCLEVFQVECLCLH